MIRNSLLTSIADRVGTPVMIYDEDMIRGIMKTFTSNFKSNKFETRVLYASKAFICGHMARIVAEENLYFDAVSGGEIFLITRATGLDAGRIYFHGNNKTKNEIREFLNLGEGHIVLDNLDELMLLYDITEKTGQSANVLIRVNPGIDAHTHKYITTATKDAKFGISIEKKDEIADMIRLINNAHHIHFKGFHAHIGSQIFVEDAFMEEINTMLMFIMHMRDRYGVCTEQLDLGGGFAVRYTREDSPIPLEKLCSDMIAALENGIQENDLDIKCVIIEPGRSIVCEAGCTVYGVGSFKKTDTLDYIFTDGGMADNIRPALYQAEYSCENISRPDAEKSITYEIAGKCCESGDILVHDALLPETSRGDFLKINSTGAYGYSMASNYNRLGRPAVVFVRDSKPRLVIRRETYRDMLVLDEENIS